jgi:hypothetical protein
MQELSHVGVGSKPCRRRVEGEAKAVLVACGEGNLEGLFGMAGKGQLG